MLHPKIGSGRPEQLKYELTGKWSRRIDDEHRMVYTIDEEVVVVEVLKMRYHYD
jgi:toxin YoeB